MFIINKLQKTKKHNVNIDIACKRNIIYNALLKFLTALNNYVYKSSTTNIIKPKIM